MKEVDEYLARTDAVPQEGDYIQDGLLFCGKCHTAKQIMRMYRGRERAFGCLCDCGAKKRDEDEEAMRKSMEADAIELRRNSTFPDASMKENTFQADDSSLPKISNAMREYVNHFKEFKADGRGLLLWGPVDGGKTFYAACVLNALLDRGYTCKATSFPELATKAFGFDKDNFYQSFNEYDMLLLDDMGTERRSEFMQEIIYGVIDARYKAKLPMIITTNLDIADIAKPADVANQRIFSRILERCHPIEVPKTEHRLKNGRSEFVETRKILGI